ncbi:hypothetical protein BH18ACI1_BH18ACI1_12490 [soil metagenome]
MKDTSANVFGLFELDLMGTVKYSKIDANNSSVNLPPDLIGLNFFDEIAPFGNGEELRRRFRYFAKGSDSAEKFTFTCQSNERPLEVKVMLTQISEREFDGSEKLIILAIRKVY